MGGRSPELALICGALAFVVASLIFVALFSMEALSASRAYTQARRCGRRGRRMASSISAIMSAPIRKPTMSAISRPFVCRSPVARTGFN
jgi:hypothetical protein